MSEIRKIGFGALLGLSLLSACTPASESVDTALVRETVAQDVATIYQHDDVTTALKLEEVLARALRYNLDTRVAELDELIAADDVTLEQLNALPSITASVQRIGRSNPGGSSSFSLLTGTQSLQPSISSDQYRTVKKLNAEWNLLDAGIGLWRAKSASDRVLIAQERRRKVYHDVVQDAYSAFWRAAAAQETLPVIETLLADSEKQSARIDQQIEQGLVPLGDAQGAKADLLERRKRLLGMKQTLMLSGVELKTLIDYPIDEPLALDLDGQSWMTAGGLPSLKGDIDDFSETAFLNRPEIREEVLNKKITTRKIKQSIIETLPGAELVLTYNDDSNSFLSYNTWVDWVAGLTASLNKIITAPTRYNRAKNEDLLADKRRQALLAAVMTQVHVAKARYDYLTLAYRENEAEAKNATTILRRARNFSDNGLMSGAELLNVTIDSELARVNQALAYADAQDAYGRFITTLGVDVWDADNAGLGVPEFAQQIKKNLNNENLFVTAQLEAEVVE